MFRFRYITVVFLILYIQQGINGQAFTHYTIGKTNFSHKDYHEFSPVFYDGGLVITTNRQKGMFSYSSPETGGLFNMYYADTIGELGKHKVKYFSKQLNTRMNDGPATFSGTGDTIYFTRNRLVDAKIDELSSPWNKLGIYSAVNVDGKWAGIEEFRYNSEWYNVTTPSLSPDGKRIYFASDKPQGYGGSDIYYSERKNGFWEYPVNLGPLINTPGNESFPFISPLGELFFSSDSLPGMGGKDIFVTRYADTAWLEPVALAAPINSEYDDFGFICDTLIKTGYFSSDRDRSIDIYHFNTEFPQLFFKNYQRENRYCYTLIDDGLIRVDTTLLEFVWHFGNGSTAKGAVVKHCYPGTGDYNVRLDLMDRATGKLYFRKVEYQLRIKEIVQGYISGPGLAVKGEEVEFSGLKSNLPGFTMVDFAWDLGDQGRAKGPVIRHSYAEDGEYELTLFLTLRSNDTGMPHKANVTRRIKVVNNSLEREYIQAEDARRMLDYEDIRMHDVAELTTLYSAEKDMGSGSVYCIGLLESKEKLPISDPVFRQLPDKYILKERYDDARKVYSYTVEQQLSLMALYPSFREISGLGFTEARVKLITLKDPAETELLTVRRNYALISDVFFDRSERLTPDGFIILDEILEIFLKYPRIGMEIGVYTDDSGSASRNLSVSTARAKAIEDYLITRGVSRGRIISRGYGESKPVNGNGNEEERRANRRVEFVIIQ